jgi:fatty-acyl-CoA synthase
VPLNTRLSAPELGRLLEHSGARVVVAATGVRDTVDAALSSLDDAAPEVLWVDPESSGACAYEHLLATAQPRDLERPEDERALLSINYTSGTTSAPKGVMTSHRGAYLHSLGVVAEARLEPRSAYLWTLPMFHCNGWAYTWAVTATGARHLCLPRVEPEAIWAAMVEDGVTHLCAAPTVMTMLLESPAARRRDTTTRLFVGGAPPAPALLERARALDIDVTHLYGLTETYGPIAVCAWNPGWDALPVADQERRRARQGVATIVSERLRVVDDQMRDVPRDGRTLGEVVMRGNNVMLGYYRDPEATERAFAGGWFHSGDVGVMHPDGYVELRDRLKDIIISGGENISTIEVEQALAAHPSVSEAAVVGMPDERWGEVPIAFVTLRRDHHPVTPETLRAAVREHLAGFKVPKRVVVVDDLPKTPTGKIRKHELREQLASGTTPASTITTTFDERTTGP